MLDIGWLSGLDATTEKQIHHAPFTREINPIARAAVDAHLGYTVFQQFHVAEMSAFRTPDPHEYFCPRS